MDIFEAMHTQRAIRWYKPDPVSDEDIRTILTAAIHAPSGATANPGTSPAINSRIHESGCTGSG